MFQVLRKQLASRPFFSFACRSADVVQLGSIGCPEDVQCCMRLKSACIGEPHPTVALQVKNINCAHEATLIETY